MLVYDGTKTDFLRSVENDTIAVEIEENIYRELRSCGMKDGCK